MELFKRVLLQVDNLKSDLPDIADRIVRQNEDLNELTKEYLGEEISEYTMGKINKQEFNKEVMRRLGDIFGR
jgi:hypothetical protein